MKATRSTKLLLILSVSLLFALFSIPTSAYVITEGGGHQLYWADSNLPITYQINPQGTPDAVGEFSAIQYSFKTWEDVLSVKISFRYAGKTTLGQGAAPDLKNVILWVETDWETISQADPNVIALTTTFFNSLTGQILDADIEFNGEYY